MIFADKLIELRKKSGWSQEELAEQMNVTRQSVSKWEGAQSVPDLEKIIQLSKLFGVSTDYLLKDEIEPNENESASLKTEEKLNVRRVSMEEANKFLAAKTQTAKTIACGTFLCIISPICLMILSVMSEKAIYNISENVAAGIGMITLLIFIANAVTLFILSSSKTSAFEFLENEIFETSYGVTGMVKERKEEYRESYTKNIAIGVCFCVLSLVPLFAAIIISEDDLFMVSMVAVMLALIGIGVNFIVKTCTIWESFDKLLQEGEYSKRKKKEKIASSKVNTIYWSVVTAGYLAYSFISSQWHFSWIIWPVAAVLYPAVISIFASHKDK